MMHDAFVFLQKHLLHWVEAMSIVGLASEIAGIIDIPQSVLQGDKVSEDSEVVKFLHDTKRFLLENGQFGSESGDKKVRLWDIATGALTQVLESHSGWVRKALKYYKRRLAADL
ncbi:hypothetical protein BDV19DRAFT_364417 [Aspergillus venezuelensis]